MAQETQQQEPIFISLSLNIEQINFILNALGKLPTDSGAWIVRQIVSSQAQQQLDALPKEETQEETPTVQ